MYKMTAGCGSVTTDAKLVCFRTKNPATLSKLSAQSARIQKHIVAQRRARASHSWRWGRSLGGGGAGQLLLGLNGEIQDRDVQLLGNLFLDPLHKARLAFILGESHGWKHCQLQVDIGTEAEPKHVHEEAGAEGVGGDAPWEGGPQSHRDHGKAARKPHEPFVEPHHPTAVCHPALWKEVDGLLVTGGAELVIGGHRRMPEVDPVIFCLRYLLWKP